MPNSPHPLPTPYDIAAIPVFTRSFTLFEITAAFVLCVLVVWIVYRLVKRKPHSAALKDVILLTQNYIEQLHAKDSISKSDLGILHTRVRRLLEWCHADPKISQNVPLLQASITHLESLVYGPHVDQNLAQETLEHILTALTTKKEAR